MKGKRVKVVAALCSGGVDLLHNLKYQKDHRNDLKGQVPSLGLAFAERSCRKNEFLALEAVELFSRKSSHANPSRQYKGEEEGSEDTHFLCQMELEQDCYNRKRNVIQN